MDSFLGVLLIANNFGGNARRTDDCWQELRSRGQMWHQGLIEMIFETSWNTEILKTCITGTDNLCDG